MKRIIKIKAANPEVAQRLSQDLMDYFETRDRKSEPEPEVVMDTPKKVGFFKRLFGKKDK